MRYPFVFYVDSLPEKVGGRANGPIIRILKKHRGDEGMYRHELVHVKQWVRTFGLHPVMYALSKSYRLRAEVEAYREQAKCYPEDRSQLFAYFIAHRYGLSVSIAEALSLLKQ